MEERNQGTLAIIGSVAGDRGKKSNYVYGAAKGLLARYVQGLQHRFAKSNVKIVLIKPGPTDTPMTAEMKAKGVKMASAEVVAQIIVVGINQGEAIIYAPKKWGAI
jgi:decaprenylphospho-beta-D-erythro-pentofuranosid-2-ulose 2-reductase